MLPIAVKVDMRLVIAAGIVGIVHLVLHVILPKGGLYYSDSGLKYLQVVALTTTGQLAIGIDEPFSALRPEVTSVMVSRLGDRLYAAYPPSYALMTAPFLWLFGTPGLTIPSILSLVIASWATGLASRRLGRGPPWLAALIVGLATPFVFYGHTLWEHLPAVACMAIGLWLWLRESDGKSGAILGVAAWFRPEALFFAVSLVVGTLIASGVRQGKARIPGFALGLLLGLSPLVASNILLYGQPAGLQAAPVATQATSLVTIAMINLVPLGVRKWAVAFSVIMGVVAFRLLSKRDLGPVFPLVNLSALVIALANLLQGGWRSIVELGNPSLFVTHGLFDVFPLGIAALITLPDVRRDPILRLLWGTTVAYVVLALVAVPVHFGGGWGPRYLLPAYLPLALLVIRAVSRPGDWLSKVSTMGLLGLSIFVQGVGLRDLQTSTQTWIDFNSELQALRPQRAVTAVWVVPQVGASSIGVVDLRGVANEAELAELSNDGAEFWWISTPGGFGEERPLALRSELPANQFQKLDWRDFSRFRLDATLYRAVF